MTKSDLPSGTVRQAIAKMKHSTWETQSEGINLIKQLVKENPADVKKKSAIVIPLVHKQTTNLRSSLSRDAILCLNAIFAEIGNSKECSRYLDLVIPTLIQKNALSSRFIAGDAKNTIQTIIDNVPRTADVIKPICILGEEKSTDAAIMDIVSDWLYYLIKKMDKELLSNSEKVTLQLIVRCVSGLLYSPSKQSRSFARKSAEYLGNLTSNISQLKQIVKVHVVSKHQERFLKEIGKAGSDPMSPPSTPQSTAATLENSSINKVKSIKQAQTPHHIQSPALKPKSSCRKKLSNEINYVADEDITLDGDPNEMLPQAVEVLWKEFQESQNVSSFVKKKRS